MSVFKNTGFKPVHFPAAYEFLNKHEGAHWTPQKVSLSEDVVDWNKNLSTAEKNLLTNVFLFFTQADIDVSAGYAGKYLSLVKNQELVFMLRSFLNRETIHILSYSRLIEELGMTDETYEEFKQHEAMVAKHKFMFEPREGNQGLLESIAVFSAFGEGLQLFGSFVILFHFTRASANGTRGRMRGMGDIVRWSIRDECIHVEGMTWLFRQIFKELKDTIDIDSFCERVYMLCEKMIELEDAFIDLCFKDITIEGITPDEVKLFIRFLADCRLEQLGLDKKYHVNNPFDWTNGLIFAEIKEDFFSATTTKYSDNGNTVGNFF